MTRDLPTRPKPIALLDLDNSLRTGWVIVDWAEALSLQSLLPPGAARAVRVALDQYLAHELEYDTAAEAMLRALAEGLSGRAADDVQQHAASFVARDAALRPWVRPLLAELSDRSVSSTLVSGAPQEILDAMVGYHPNLRAAYGTTLAVTQGRYSGSVAANRASARGKMEVLEHVLGHADWVLVSVGDSLADIPILELADVPIVVDNAELASRFANSILLSADATDISAILERLDRG